MSRIIKFRVWITSKKHWYDPQSAYRIHFGLDGTMVPNAKGSEVNEFTGVHDKNGKEIYEGDIVNANWFMGGPFQVGFNRGGFCFYKDESDNYYNDCKYLNNFEVIGNIYENPELLKD